MTPQEARERLVAIATHDAHVTGRYGSGPWLLVADGRELAFSTDGHLMAAYPRECVSGDVAPCPEKVAPVALKWLAYQGTPTLVGAGRLKAFAGLPEPVLPPCERCNGTGEVTCDECDGDGTTECVCDHCADEHEAECDNCTDGKADCPVCKPRTKSQPGQLLTAVIDRRVLARALQAVDLTDDESIHVSCEKNQTYVLQPVGVQTWRLVIMAMAEYVKPEAHFAETVDA